MMVIMEIMVTMVINYNDNYGNHDNSGNHGNCCYNYCMLWSISCFGIICTPPHIILKHNYYEVTRGSYDLLGEWGIRGINFC